MHRREEQAAREKDPEQAAYYRSNRWRKLSEWVRSRDPICTVCNRRPSQQAHHKDGDWRNGDPENLAGICKGCHASESGRQHRRRQG